MRVVQYLLDIPHAESAIILSILRISDGETDIILNDDSDLKLSSVGQCLKFAFGQAFSDSTLGCP